MMSRVTDDPFELVLLERAPNDAVAGALKSLLEGVGIPAHVQGAYLADEFAVTQRLAVGVEVRVPRARLEEARRLVEDARREVGNSRAGAPCPKCGERAEPGFAICWKCGAALP
jgi:hypothetical protein